MKVVKRNKLCQDEKLCQHEKILLAQPGFLFLLLPLCTAVLMTTLPTTGFMWSKVEQLGTMPNLKFLTFLNKNHPIGREIHFPASQFLPTLAPSLNTKKTLAPSCGRILEISGAAKIFERF